jgi:hypothetical protein
MEKPLQQWPGLQERCFRWTSSGVAREISSATTHAATPLSATRGSGIRSNAGRNSGWVTSTAEAGCSGDVSDNNFVLLRESIQSNIKEAQKGPPAKKLYIIDALVWSESLTAEIADDQNAEVGGNLKAELAALATGTMGRPNIDTKFAKSNKNSASIEQTRAHWAYRAVPLKVDVSTGTLVVDRNAGPLILSPL